MFAVHGYKWLLSPNGAGFMYVSPQLREWLARRDRLAQPQRLAQPERLHHGEPEFRTRRKSTKAACWLSRRSMPWPRRSK